MLVHALTERDCCTLQNIKTSQIHIREFIVRTFLPLLSKFASEPVNNDQKRLTSKAFAACCNMPLLYC